MSFDLSRKIFNPLEDYLGVVMQQGRVQTDADWNTLVAQFKRRLQAGSLDTFGPSAVPRETADGFLITGSATAPEIGAGRLYVDGLLAENHTETLKWDARLAETSGTARLSGAQLDAAPTGPAGTTPYNDQPYFPDPPALPADETTLLYVDVWQRDITYLQDAGLVDAAVGVDTTARQQTVWQVKGLTGVGDIDAGTPDVDIPGWLQTIHPSSARLSTATGAVSGSDDPCLLPPQAGYKGLENQLYRVQVHDGGPLGTATFKWSRENATVATRISAMPGGNEIVVDSLGRDEASLGFQEGDWVEVIDDHRELLGLPGELRRIAANGIDRATRTITLEGDPLPIGTGPGQFPVDASQQTDTKRNTRLIRWDQAGVVLREDETNYTDLDAAGSTGAITIPATGTRLFLEKGILVDFDLEAVVDAADFAPEFKSGDYWVFAARVNDASIEILDRAPPQGIHHHYAKLAIVKGDEITDCRTLWPPVSEGTGCACTVCVSVENHNNGTATIQQAIDQVVARGGGTVCLDVGEYQLKQPLRINGKSVTLRGQGWQTLLLSRETQPLLEIGGKSVTTDITVEHLTAFTTTAKGFNNAVSVKNVLGLNLNNCFIANFASGDGTSQGIQFTGIAGLVTLRQCNIIAERGIIGPRLDDDYLGTLDFSLHQCLLMCSIQGLSFSELSFHLGQLDIHRCQFSGSRETGIELTGAVLDNSAVSIEHNLLTNCQHGIRSGVSNLRILHNDLQTRGDQKESGHGIALVEGLDPGDSANQQIIGNRISNYRGHAMVVQAGVGKLMVKQNQVNNILGAGFAIVGTGSVAYLSLENNQFTNVHGVLAELKTLFAAVYLQAAVRADIGNNLFERVAHANETINVRAGIFVASSNQIGITGNRLHAVAVNNYTGLGAGIIVASNVGDYSVENNEISRISDSGDDKQADVTWIPLYVLAISLGDIQFMAGSATGRMNNAAFFNAAPVTRFIPANDTSLLQDTPVFTSKDQSYALLADRLVSLGAASAKSNVTVTGNQLNGLSGATTSVFAYVANYCGFTDNKVESQNDATQVILASNHLGANNNRLYDRNSKVSLQIQAKNYVVMGNMSTGAILVNSGDGEMPPPEPWKSLNITF